MPQLFSCDFCDIFKKTFFTEHFQVTASVFVLAWAVECIWIVHLWAVAIDITLLFEEIWITVKIACYLFSRSVLILTDYTLQCDNSEKKKKGKWRTEKASAKEARNIHCNLNVIQRTVEWHFISTRLQWALQSDLQTFIQESEWVITHCNNMCSNSYM